MVGRLVVGLGIGASAIVVPAYLAEISPAARRGAVVQMYEVMLCVGMLVSVLMDWLLKVRGCWHVCTVLVCMWCVWYGAIPASTMHQLGAGPTVESTHSQITMQQQEAS